MVFVRITKTKAYFKRFQTKFKRRRDGKTNYRMRRRLITQDKTKFNAPRYRLVIRITNRDVIAQIISAKLAGDCVFAAAYAHELKRYGIPVGLTNYSACYATGLLLARRVLKKIGLDKQYAGVAKPNGEHFLVEEPENGARPFRCYPDIGLARITTGARIFALIKGAADGGLHVPHSDKRFPGFNKESGEFDAKKLKERIFGAHVAAYMKMMKKDDPEKYKKQFSQYIKNKIEPEGVEKMYSAAFDKIRANPDFVAVAKKEKIPERKSFNKKKLSNADRKARVASKKAKYMKHRKVEAEEEEMEVEEEEVQE